MSPKYKLTYFNMRGLGESIKYIFAYKNVEYECETIAYGNGGMWHKIQGDMPFRQLPILEFDGQLLFQSQAINLYLGGQFDLTTGDPFKDALLVAYGNTVQDLAARVLDYYYARDPQEKEKLRIDREENVIPFYLSRFEKIINENGGFLSSKLSWADFYVAASLESISSMMGNENLLKNYPGLCRFVSAIHELPGVKEYVNKRPHTIR